MPRSTRGWLILVLLLFFPGSAFAAMPRGEQSGEVEGVRCTVRYSWPDNLARGYFPVEVEVLNTNAEDVTVVITAEQHWAEEDFISRRVTLAAGERFPFEMLLRARTRGQNQYGVTFEALGSESRISGLGPSQYPHGSYQRTVLYVSQDEVEAGINDSLTAEWSEAYKKSGSSTGPSQLTVTCVTFDELSPSWQAYTSLDSVVLDLGRGELGPERLAAILGWVRGGGKLIVVGIARAELRRHPDFAPLLEERFKTDPESEEPGFSDFELEAYRHGFGAIVIQRASPDDELVMRGAPDGDSPAFAADATVFPVAWTRGSFSRASRLSSALHSLGSFDNLPLRALMLLMIGFAILMGPVNFLWVKRMRKPMMILVTVPIIAFAASVSLFLYGVLAQGLDVKSITKTWAIIDQRTGQGTTIEARNVFAGSALGEGMRPAESTLVYPEERYWRGSYRNEHLFRQDLDDGRLLSGDFFPIRVPVGQMIVSNRTVRLRLDTRLEGDRIVVSNALGSDVEELLLRTPDGEYHHLDKDLSQGEVATLVPGGSSAKSVEWSDQLAWFWGAGTTRLLPGTFLARLDSSPSADDCGIEVSEVEGEHVLLGILDEREESWK